MSNNDAEENTYMAIDTSNPKRKHSFGAKDDQSSSRPYIPPKAGETAIVEDTNKSTTTEGQPVPGNDVGQAEKGNKMPSRGKGVEAVTNLGSDLEADPEADPELLDRDGGSNDPFEGAGCETVAKISTNRRIRYVNRYGPRRYPWFVMSDDLRLKDGEKEEDLVNIASSFSRTLDQPIDPDDEEKVKKKFGKKDIAGVLGLVWDFGAVGTPTHPSDAVEFLNPEKVKEGLTNAKDRRAKKTRLSAYPTTYVWVKFTRPVNEVIKGQKLDNQVVTSWELGSKYRSAFGKSHIAREQDLYQDAKRQSKRFIKWYEENVDGKTRESSILYDREFNREPTINPRRGTSPSPSLPLSPSPSPNVIPSIEEDEIVSDTSKAEADRNSSRRRRAQTISPSSANTTKEAENKMNKPAGKTPEQAQRARTVLPTPRSDGEEGGEDDEEPTEADFKDAFLYGFKSKYDIRGKPSKKEQMMFDVAWKAYRSG